MVKALESPPTNAGSGGVSQVDPIALSGGGKITEVTLNATTWVPIVSTSLTNRRVLNIQNESGQRIKINYDNTVAGFVGYSIPDGGERNYDVLPSFLLYGKCESGTAVIMTEEVAHVAV